MTFPTPLTAQAPQLDAVADEILADAATTASPRIYSTTGGAKRHISIVHQQKRCANLAWALKRRGRVKAGDVVAVVGGSFSGMMIAASLALCTDLIVYMFEKEKRPLHRFRDKAHRHLSPVLNSRDLGKGFDPWWSSPDPRRPIFAWDEASASDVAAQWLEEWNGYYRRLPIFTFDVEVTADHVKPHTDGVTIETASAAFPHAHPIEVDLLVDATGFGDERNDLNLVDHSYWESGHRLIYDHLLRPAKVMISGCGDSGVIEALHYAVDGFRHDWVRALWRRHEAQIDEGLRAARLSDVYEEGGIDGLEVTSEVGWWLQMHHRIQHNPQTNWLDLEDHHRPFFEAIDAVLDPLLKAEMDSDDDIDWAHRERLCSELSDDVQREVRAALKPLAEHWISLKIARLAQTFEVDDALQALQAELRPGVEIILNGLTPTPYSLALSPYNVWLLRLLLSLPNVRYQQGRIARVVERSDRAFDVLFETGRSERCDRVVSRYGADGGCRLTECPPTLREPGGGMLARPLFQTPHPTQSNIVRTHDAAFNEIRSAAEALDGRRAPAKARDVSKSFYVRRLLEGAAAFPEDHDLFEDPQAWLSSELQQGRCPRFDIDDTVEAAARI